MAAWANVKKTVYFLRRNGLKPTFHAVWERLAAGKAAAYQYVPPTARELDRQRSSCQRLFDGQGQALESEPPLFSILVPAYRTREAFLRELIDSLLAQTYSRWQLVIADATKEDDVESVVTDYEDSRICYVRLKENGGISGNSNQGLEYVAGSYVGLLDHDDILTPNALYEMYEAIQRGKNRGIEAKLLYSDEDKCDEQGRIFYEPNIKEDFNLDLLLSNNYICHFLVIKTELLKELGFRPEYEGAQDYDLTLRASERILASGEGQEQLVHIPKVLYHWRCHGASTAVNPRSKEYAYEAGRRALQDFADRQRIPAKAENLPHLGFYRLKWEQDIFICRPDLGAVGGKLLHRGRIVGGRMDEYGKIYYEGLPAGFSGILHRAALTQDAMAVDIRLIKVRPQCHELFEKAVGVSYTRVLGTDIFDSSTLPAGTDYVAVSLALGRALRGAGYRILWEPELKGKV
ncbi:MAG: glycosyltransferase [Roseburia sp.]|nr:glycosyltransferase [Roseburia sp.]